MGDAAHLVNPLAGQGVNMGFGDVKQFAKIAQGYSPSAPHSEEFIATLHNDYGAKRQRENTTMMLTLDAIYNVFKQEAKPIQLLRQLGLMAADKSGPLKKAALKRAAGLVDF